MDVEVTKLAPRAGTIRAQITDDLLEQVKAGLDSTTPGDRKSVAIGGAQEKEGTARTIVEAVMHGLALMDPPVHVRTHITVVKDDNDKVTGYRGSVSKTLDGKPSRKLRNNGAAAATTPDAPADTPADPPAETPADTTTTPRKR